MAGKESSSWGQERRGDLSADPPASLISYFLLVVVSPMESQLCWTSSPSGGLPFDSFSGSQVPCSAPCASFTFESGRNAGHVTGWSSAEGRTKWTWVGSVGHGVNQATAAPRESEEMQTVCVECRGEQKQDRILPRWKVNLRGTERKKDYLGG